MKETRMILALLGAIALCQRVVAATSVTIGGISLDTREIKIAANRTVGVTYDAGWNENGAVAVVAANGTEIAQGALGLCEWAMSCKKTNNLQLTIKNSSGQTVETLSAVVVNVSPSSDEHNRVVTISAVDPTCTSPGRTAEVRCTRCQDVVEESRTLAALGHQEVVTVEGIAPTYTTAGKSREVKCERCSETLEQIRDLPMLESVRNVRARQRYPWNGKVDIDFELADNGLADELYDVCLLCKNCDTGSDIPVRTIEGSTTLRPGRHRITWDADKDAPNLKLPHVKFGVAATGSKSTSGVEQQ